MNKLSAINKDKEILKYRNLLIHCEIYFLLKIVVAAPLIFAIIENKYYIYSSLVILLGLLIDFVYLVINFALMAKSDKDFFIKLQIVQFIIVISIMIDLILIYG